jgi:hypothetical protein
MFHYIFIALAVAAGISIYKIVELAIKLTIRYFIGPSEKTERLRKESYVNDLDGLDDL